jgi:hypothetical protein
MLITAVLAVIVGAWGIVTVSLGLYFTTMNFWRSPEFGWRRNADYTMVLVSMAYCSFVFLQLNAPWPLIWCCCLGTIAVIFISNETRFWFNSAKTAADYRSVVWVHCLGVHCLAILSTWLLLYGLHSCNTAAQRHNNSTPPNTTSGGTAA